MSNEVEKIIEYIYILKLFLQNNFTGCTVERKRWNVLTSLFFFLGKNILYFFMLNLQFSRDSRPELFRKKVVLKNFAKFTRKHLYQRMFDKLFFYLFFNIIIESTNNYITDPFEISKTNLTIMCYL